MNKTNVKTGGLNYTITPQTPVAAKILGGGILFIGFGMNHPAGRFGAASSEGNGEAKNGNGNGNGNGNNGGNGANGKNGSVDGSNGNHAMVTPSIIGV